MRSRDYGRDVLAPENRKPRPGQGPVPTVEAERDLVVEDFEGRFCGAVVAVEAGLVTLEDRFGKRRVFPLPGTFLLEGKRVTLVKPSPKPEMLGNVGRRTASGSVAAPRQRAKVAKASRIYVEGKHDAELVEKIWGDDLRDVGIVVEFLEGVDDLPPSWRTSSPRTGGGSACCRPSGRGVEGERIAAAASADPTRADRRAPVRRRLAGVRPAAVGLRRGRTCRGGSHGRKGVSRASAGDGPSTTWRPPGGASCAR